MGKVPKFKSRTPSLHSRAAKRADLPSAPEDDWKTPGDDDRKSGNRPGVLAASQAGVSKKKKQKPLTRQQRLRREKGIDRAEQVMDQMETKVDKSKGKGRMVQGRRATWEELNEAKARPKTAADGQVKRSLGEEVMEDAQHEKKAEAAQQTTSTAQIEMDGIS